MNQDRHSTLRIALCGWFAAFGLLAGAFSAEAQPAERVFRIGFLSFMPLPNAGYEAFRQGMRDLKYLEGRNYVMVTRAADGHRDRLPQLAAELVAANPDVVVVMTGNAALEARKATGKIPIVMTGSSDAVTQGIVQSLARPGGNITGFTVISPDLAPKRLQLLASLPGLSAVAVLWCPESPVNHAELRRTSEVAASLGIRIAPVEYRQKGMDWAAMEAALLRIRPQALFLVDCTYLPFEQIFAFANAHRLPTISPSVRLAERGALMVYGADFVAMSRRAAALTDKVLRGARPADLPVEQPTKFEFVINLKTAKQLGITIPQTLMISADRIIE